MSLLWGELLLLASPAGEKGPRPSAACAGNLCRQQGRGGQAAGEGGTSVRSLREGDLFAQSPDDVCLFKKKKKKCYLQKLTGRLFPRRLCILVLIDVVHLLLAAVLGRLYR